MKIRTIILFVGCSLHLGCASAIKEKCEKENWLEYGRSHGSQGSSWQDQPYLDECQKEGISPKRDLIQKGYAEAKSNYCVPEAFKKSAAEGDIRKIDFCLLQDAKKLQAAIDAGVATHCTKQGAAKRGTSGKNSAADVCPENTRRSYEQAYVQGRSSFLKQQISSREQRLSFIDRRTHVIDSEIPGLEQKVKRLEDLQNKKSEDKSATESLESILGSTLLEPEKELTNRKNEKKILAEEKIKLQEQLEDLKAQLSANDALILTVPSGALDQN